MADNEWKKVCLGELVTIKHGYPFKSEFFSEFRLGQPIVVNIGNFNYTGGFRFESTTLKVYGGDYPKEFVLTPGDILLVMTCQTSGGEILGIPGRVPNDEQTYLHNQRMGKVVITDPARVEGDFLYWLFLSPNFNRELFTSASGTKILHTSPNRIEAFCFRLPSLPEQQAIAHILGTLDDKIELNQQMNRNLEAIAQAIFKSWFVDFDPLRAKIEGRQPVGMDATTAELFPDSFEDSSLGKIPQGWRVGVLEEITDIVMGQSPPGKTYNELGEGLPFYQGVRDFSFRFPTRRVYCTASTRFAEKGDVLFSVRAPVGNLNIAVERCAVGRGVAALRLKPKHGGFLYYCLRATQSEWEKFEAGGTVFGSVSKNDVHSFKLIIPILGVIEKFNYLTDSINARIESNEQESRILANLRDTLLPKLMSGEIRVKDAEKILEVVA